jgi:mutator protein MutT
MSTMVVTAAIVEREGTFLVTRRQKGTHLEGYWEFPGGKCEPGETLAAALARELHEELAVSARIGDEIFTTTHAYSGRRIELHFFRCELMGAPQPQMGQEMRWVSRADLATLAFPPADAELIDVLRRSS